MSFTATGVVPTSLNANFFSHANTSRDEPQDSKRIPDLGTDDDDVFSLDMVTMDMDFEQAYSAYIQMQQKNALVGIENLQKLKNQSATPTMHDHHTDFYPMSPKAQSSHPQDSSNLNRNSHSLQSNPCHSNAGGYYDSIPGLPLLLPPNEAVSEGAGLFRDGKTANPVGSSSNDGNIDHFFLNTESDALEKFLDNMALSSSSNPLDLYQNQSSSGSHGRLMLDMHTMDPVERRVPTQRDIPDYIKKEITDAFRHPPVQSLKSFGSNDGSLASQQLQQHQHHHQQQQLHLQKEQNHHFTKDNHLQKPAGTEAINTQLPTPMDSRQVSNASFGEKRSASVFDEDNEGLQSPPWSPTLGKRRRSLTKPLLLLEQKRLNHLHSEQKRRLLCKQAYERCLRLITNVDDYKYDLVSASAATSSKKKSKRKQINKDGLPNLSKHTALLKVSGEIIKIRNKNDQLRKLIEQY